MPDSIIFRPLDRADFPLLRRWLVEPHVLTWWRTPLDLAGVHAKYGPRVDGTEPTHVFVIEVDGRPAGWIQWYRWADYSTHAEQLGATTDSAGMDLAIGEKEMMGRGLAPDIIRQFLQHVIFSDPAIQAVFVDPEEKNLRSVNAFGKVGFTVVQKVKLPGENCQRCVMRLGR